MGDHLVLRVDRLITPKSLQSLEGEEFPGASGEGSCSHTAGPSTSTIDIKDVEEHDDADEQEPLIQMVECRICQEEDSIKNLEVPCACNGSLKVSSLKPILWAALYYVLWIYLRILFSVLPLLLLV